MPGLAKLMSSSVSASPPPKAKTAPVPTHCAKERFGGVRELKFGEVNLIDAVLKIADGVVVVAGFEHEGVGA